MHVASFVHITCLCPQDDGLLALAVDYHHNVVLALI